MEGILEEDTHMTPVASTSAAHVLSSVQQNRSNNLSDCEGISSQSCHSLSAKSTKKSGPSARGNTKRSLDTCTSDSPKRRKVILIPDYMY